MDRFTYTYLDIDYSNIGGGQVASNRLDYVHDSGIDYTKTEIIDEEEVISPLYDDIKTEPAPKNRGQTTGNYKYNKLGELIEDVQENMILHWRYGDHKLQKIERTDDDSPEVEFFYNPLGVRVGKLEKPRENGQLKPQTEWKYHYYAYDANSLSRCEFSRFSMENRSKTTIGRMLMGVYESATSEYTYNTSGRLSSVEGSNAEIHLEERYIYGASRVGAIKERVREYGGLNQIVLDVKDHTLGQKRYHLTNHLGTVNVTISDRKTYNPTDNHYEAVVTSYAETYAFGMLMPGRSFNADGQRFLYHGMEHDLEVSGNGNSYTTEFRQYDPRLGRWKSLDPLMSMFPHMSPYVGFANNPIYYTDPYGLAPTNTGGGAPEETGTEKGGEISGDNKHVYHCDDSDSKKDGWYKSDGVSKREFKRAIRYARKQEGSTKIFTYEKDGRIRFGVRVFSSRGAGDSENTVIDSMEDVKFNRVTNLLLGLKYRTGVIVWAEGSKGGFFGSGGSIFDYEKINTMTLDELTTLVNRGNNLLKRPTYFAKPRYSKSYQKPQRGPREKVYEATGDAIESAAKPALGNVDEEVVKEVVYQTVWRKFDTINGTLEGYDPKRIETTPDSVEYYKNNPSFDEIDSTGFYKFPKLGR